MAVNKKGQVWIESVLYTLIGLGLIGMVLAFAMPKITDSKDRAAIEQAINSLNDLDEKINIISGVSGQSRNFEITLKKGELLFDLTNDKIVMTIGGLRKLYSEADTNIKQGRVTIRSEKEQKLNSVSLTLDYNNPANPSSRLNLLWKTGETSTKDDQEKLTPAPTPYQLSLASKRVTDAITKISEMQIIISETGA